MNIKRVLILSSTGLATAACRLLSDFRILAGFLPGVCSTSGGRVSLVRVRLAMTPTYNIKLSIRCSQMLENLNGAFSLNNGLRGSSRCAGVGNISSELKEYHYA